MAPITAEEALDALNEYLRQGTDVVFAGRSDWGRVRRILPAVPSRFAAAMCSADKLRQRLLDAEAGQAHALAVETLSEVLVKAVRGAGKGIAPLTAALGRGAFTTSSASTR
ncbi:hypothetical protein [Streptomyces sp. Ac-502]|uniref:hypothetical protein n=1 Tax=Streptomyces sp. Ac-502 TaxID=3342801 RepID=UPI003862BE35